MSQGRGRAGPEDWCKSLSISGSTQVISAAGLQWITPGHLSWERSSILFDSVPSFPAAPVRTEHGHKDCSSECGSRRDHHAETRE